MSLLVVLCFYKYCLYVNMHKYSQLLLLLIMIGVVPIDNTITKNQDTDFFLKPYHILTFTDETRPKKEGSICHWLRNTKLVSL